MVMHDVAWPDQMIGSMLLLLMTTSDTDVIVVIVLNENVRQWLNYSYRATEILANGHHA